MPPKSKKKVSKEVVEDPEEESKVPENPKSGKSGDKKGAKGKGGKKRSAKDDDEFQKEIEEAKLARSVNGKDPAAPKKVLSKFMVYG